VPCGLLCSWSHCKAYLVILVFSFPMEIAVTMVTFLPYVFVRYTWTCSTSWATPPVGCGITRSRPILCFLSMVYPRRGCPRFTIVRRTVMVSWLIYQPPRFFPLSSTHVLRDSAELRWSPSSFAHSNHSFSWLRRPPFLCPRFIFSQLRAPPSSLDNLPEAP